MGRGDRLVVVDNEPLVASFVVMISWDLVALVVLAHRAVKSMTFLSTMSGVSDEAMATLLVFQCHLNSFGSIAKTEPIDIVASEVVNLVKHNKSLSRVRG